MQQSVYHSFFSRMHLALKAYQELLLNLNEMDHSQDENIRQSSNVIKSKMLPALVPGQLCVSCVLSDVFMPQGLKLAF